VENFGYMFRKKKKKVTQEENNEIMATKYETYSYLRPYLMAGLPYATWECSVPWWH